MLTRVLKSIKRYMIRPVVYKVIARLMYGFTLCLLYDRFAKGARIGFAYLLTALAFFLMAWLSLMRFDGARLPEMLRTPPPRKKKKNILYGDMIDYVDEEIIPFDELEKEERDAVTFAADMICGAVFLVASLF